MPLITLTTTGEIFESSIQEFDAGVAPTTKIEASHSFRTPWRDFLDKITMPGAIDRLMHSYVSVYLGNPY